MLFDRFLPRLVFALLAACISPASPLRADVDEADSVAAWEDATILLFERAHRAFAALAEEPDASRSDRLGAASTLLNVQPRTAANVSRAASQLAEILADDSEDDVGLTADYLLARIAHHHRSPADIPGALARYDALAARAPAHVLGQRARLKALLIRLYERADPDEKRRRMEAADALEAGFTALHLRSEYHQAMATAGARFGQPAAWRLRHLLAAAQLGVVRFNERRDNLLHVAEAARAAGEREIALRYYEKYIQVGVRDERRAYVTQRYEAYRDGLPVP